MNKISLPGNDLDSQYIYALMTYPNNDYAQGKLLAAAAGYYLTKDVDAEKPITLKSDLINLIADSGSYSSLLDESSTKAIHGRVAGDILVFIARMKLSGYQEPSKNKAIYLAERRYASARDKNKQPVSASKPKIGEFWEMYLPVIHLWAAYNICSIPDTENFIEEFDLNQSANMDKFLSISEWFKEFAENFIPSRQPTKRQIKENLVPKNTLLSFNRKLLDKNPNVTWNCMEDWMDQELFKAQ